MKNFIERKPYYKPLGYYKKASWLDKLKFRVVNKLHRFVSVIKKMYTKL